MQSLRFILLLSFYSLTASAQVTIFSENMGSAGTTTAIAAHTFQNSGTYTYTGTADVRNTSASSGYTGASGNGNVFITTGGKYFEMSGINTSAYTSLSLSLGHWKSTTTSSNELAIEVSADGTNYTALSYSRATGTGTAVWLLISPTGTIPSTSNLRIRFTNNTSSPMFRVDDIVLTGVSTLGVELSSFTATADDRAELLSWTTESEKNAHYFSVQRAGENGVFSEMEKIDCAGNTKVKQYYHYTDEQPLSGINYYRLQQFDYDGAYIYSDVISVESHPASDEVFYNGALRLLTFPHDLLEGTFVEIVSTAGTVSDKIPIVLRINTAQVNFLPAGIYVVRYTTVSGKVATAKVLVC